MRPKLSILIPSLFSRTDQFRTLVHVIREQPRSSEVELLVITDDRRTSPGDKHNKLVSIASGDYIVHVDDDDLVMPRYTSAILEAIDASPGVDVVLVRGRRVGGGPDITFDYQIGVKPHYDQDGVLWRTPGHLCPVRTDIARSVPFESIWTGYDLRWGDQIAPRLSTQIRAGCDGEVLYLYRWDPTKPPPGPRT